MNTIKLIICLALLAVGIIIFISSTIGVNRFSKSLYRVHAAALGDTLGLMCILLSLIIWKGFTFVSLKLLAIIIFFWLGSPVASHMICRYEVETNSDLGEIEVTKK